MLLNPYTKTFTTNVDNFCFYDIKYVSLQVPMDLAKIANIDAVLNHLA